MIDFFYEKKNIVIDILSKRLLNIDLLTLSNQKHMFEYISRKTIYILVSISLSDKEKANTFSLRKKKRERFKFYCLRTFI